MNSPFCALVQATLMVTACCVTAVLQIAANRMWFCSRSRRDRGTLVPGARSTKSAHFVEIALQTVVPRPNIRPSSARAAF
jgi:hypothetical protein